MLSPVLRKTVLVQSKVNIVTSYCSPDSAITLRSREETAGQDERSLLGALSLQQGVESSFLLESRERTSLSDHFGY
jgi:hypothetical protein